MRHEFGHWPELPAVKVRVGVGKRQEAGGERRETATARAKATETAVESRRVGDGNGAYPGDSGGIARPSRSGRDGGHDAWPAAPRAAARPEAPLPERERPSRRPEHAAVALPRETAPPVVYSAGENPAERRNRIGWRR
jgi:hypothetical protein